nr:retrovirus-related Pol polyprotein from transposon TNT 1-94 [Tanacetum cinerariifolium]
MVENASRAMTNDVPSASQATASPARGEKNTKDAETNLQNELVDLLGIKAQLDRQALGAVRLSLVKNVACNVVNEKTTYGLFKAPSNMYEKPSASNKMFLIRQLFNTKMKEGASVSDHVNEFNSILSRLMSDIKLDDEVQALLLLSSLLESWSGTVTPVSGSTGSTKLKFDNIRDLILGEDIRRKTSGEYSNSLLSAEDKGKGRKQDRGKSITEADQNQRREEDRYIPCLKKRLISVGQLDEEGYHVPSDGINAAIDGRDNVALWSHRLGHMSKKGMNILALNGRILNLQKVVVGFCEPCVLGQQNKVSFIKSGNTRKLKRLELVHTYVYGPTSVVSIGGSRYYVTFIDDSSRKPWEITCSCFYGFIDKDLINLVIPDVRKYVVVLTGYGSDEMGYRFWDLKSHKVIRRRDVTFNKDSLYEANAAIDSSNLTKANQKDQVVLEDSPENLANISIVIENGLSSEFTQSPGRSSDAEAEYMAIAEAGKELVWLKNFLEELDRAQTECRLFCDNQSAIHLAKNLVFHSRTKHIKIRYHYILELVSEGTLSLKKILGAKNPADMLTKVVTTKKLKLCAASTGLRDN